MKDFDVLSLDGKLLRTFLAVHEAQSVTKAADKLGLSQSQTSHYIARLRDCLGDPLFVKNGRGIASTYRANTLAPMVSHILDGLERLNHMQDYDPAGDMDPFTIATSVTEFLPVFQGVSRSVHHRRCPAPLRFISLGARSNAPKVLQNKAADLAITVSIGRNPLEVASHRCYEVDMVCFYDPEMRKAPATIEEFCAARHAVLDFGGENKSIVDASVENAGLSRMIGLSAPNTYVLGNLLRGTDMIATLPKTTISPAFGMLAQAEPPLTLPNVGYDMLWHRRDQDSPRHKWFRDLVKAEFSSL